MWKKVSAITIFILSLTLNFILKRDICTFSIFYNIKRPRIVGDRLMTYLSRALNEAYNILAATIRRAVPAYNNASKRRPGWPNPGRPLDPYHFMRPVPVPVKRNRS